MAPEGYLAAHCGDDVTPTSVKYLRMTHGSYVWPTDLPNPGTVGLLLTFLFGVFIYAATRGAATRVLIYLPSEA